MILPRSTRGCGYAAHNLLVCCLYCHLCPCLASHACVQPRVVCHASETQTPDVVDARDRRDARDVVHCTQCHRAQPQPQPCDIANYYGIYQWHCHASGAQWSLPCTSVLVVVLGGECECECYETHLWHMRAVATPFQRRRPHALTSQASLGAAADVAGLNVVSASQPLKTQQNCAFWQKADVVTLKTRGQVCVFAKG